MLVCDRLCSMYNALVLGNLCEYRNNNISLKTRNFGLHFCRRTSVYLQAL